MRFARVLLPSSPEPRLALERDGCLYDVVELESRFAAPLLHEPPAALDDFHARVFALGCAGLGVLDDRLCAGDRPTEARLFPDELLWLPPCWPERALFVQLSSAPRDRAPRYQLGNARRLFGHKASVPFPCDEPSPDVEVSIAVFVGEELDGATVADAERAIVGYSILLGWVAREAERESGPTRARDFAATLGPLLVTRSEAPRIDDLRVRLRVDGAAEELVASLGSSLSFAEMLAFVSRHVPLAPGDVVGGPPIEGAGEAARRLGFAYDKTIEVAIERLGKVAARPVRGPERPPYRL